MKLTRKKVKPGSYNLLDSETGKLVAEAHLTGRYGADHYPWEWYLSDGVHFLDTRPKTTGVEESLKNIIGTVEAYASQYGIRW